MKKRGQVALFVVLGILVLVIILILFFLRQAQIESSGSISEGIDISQTRNEVDNIIQTCLVDISERAVWNAAEHGGFALQTNLGYICEGGFPVDDYIYTDVIEREYLDEYTYYNMEGRNGNPPLTTNINMLTSNAKICLESYIRRKLDDCVNSFITLDKKGWTVSGDSTLIEVEIGDKIEVTLNIPRTFTRDESIFQVDTYIHGVDFNLPLLFTSLKKAVDECAAGKPLAEIERSIDDDLPNTYLVYGRNREKDDLAENNYQFIIKKGDKRFKFGLTCP